MTILVAIIGGTAFAALCLWKKEIFMVAMALVILSMLFQLFN